MCAIEKEKVALLDSNGRFYGLYRVKNGSGTRRYALRLLRFMSPTVTRLEDLVGAMLASLPRSSLLNIQKKIVPLLQLDVVAVSPSSKSHLPTL